MLEKAAEDFRKESAETFDAPENYHIRIAEIPVPETVIEPELMSQFIKLTATVPNEVFEQDYIGYENFVNNVINTVFADETYEPLPTPEDYLEDENKKLNKGRF